MLRVCEPSLRRCSWVKWFCDLERGWVNQTGLRVQSLQRDPPQCDARALLAFMDRDISLHGGWWCRECSRLTSLDVSGVQSKCARCGSIELRWLRPIRNQTEPGGLGMKLSPEAAHSFFDQMRKACG